MREEVMKMTQENFPIGSTEYLDERDDAILIQLRLKHLREGVKIDKQIVIDNLLEISRIEMLIHDGIDTMPAYENIALVTRIEDLRKKTEHLNITIDKRVALLKGASE